MNYLIVGKFPPIQGGVSRSTYDIAHHLAKNGNNVFVATNANEVEWNYRQQFFNDDYDKLSAQYDNGFVKVFSTSPLLTAVIPESEAYESKLFGVCLKIVQEHNIDIIFSYYYQPYALIAVIIAKIFNIKSLVTNAGSDLGRLSHHEDLQESYKWLIENCDAYSKHSNNEEADKQLRKLGLREEKIVPSFYVNRCSFPITSDKLDLKELFDQVLDHWIKTSPLNRALMQVVKTINDKKLKRDVPTIGIYGKVGHSKSQFFLVRALLKLISEGYNFNFITIGTGSAEILERYYFKILQHKELGDRSWILPPLAPWRIPSFINLCDIGCFLEHDFTVSFHTPKVALEIAAMDKFLVYSKEIADKEVSKKIRNNSKARVVSNPHDVMELAEVLRDVLNEFNCSMRNHS
jgi:glycosyltransferase involved in cell wall biosynthesis